MHIAQQDCKPSVPWATRGWNRPIASGPGVVRLVVEPNPWGTGRTGTVNVAGQTVTVAQGPQEALTARAVARPCKSPRARALGRGDGHR